MLGMRKGVRYASVIGKEGRKGMGYFYEGNMMP